MHVNHFLTMSNKIFGNFEKQLISKALPIFQAYISCANFKQHFRQLFISSRHNSWLNPALPPIRQWTAYQLLTTVMNTRIFTWKIFTLERYAHTKCRWRINAKTTTILEYKMLLAWINIHNEMPMYIVVLNCI